MATNTSGSQDRIISDAEDFASRNEAAADSINGLVAIIDELDSKIDELQEEIEALKADAANP